MPSNTELAWAAGFFDGEGCVRFRKATKRDWPYRQLTINISQTHTDVLKRFQAAVGCGSVTGPYKQKNPNAQPFYHFNTGSFVDGIKIFKLLKPYLSATKLAQFEAALSEASTYLAERRDFRAREGMLPVKKQEVAWKSL